MINNLDLALTPGQPWPPVCEADRIKGYLTNKILFEGDHDKIFKDWIKILRDDQAMTLEIIVNFHKRLSTLWADLLLGERPDISLIGNNINNKGQEYFKKLTGDQFFQTVYKTVIDRSRYGTGVFKNRWNKTSIIESQPPAYWVSVQAPDNINEVTAHVLAYQFQARTKGLLGSPINDYIKFEIHEVGKITNRLFKIKDGKLSQEVDIKTIFPELAPVLETGVDDLLINPIHNLVTSDNAEGLDDYKDIMTIVQEIEIRLDQIAMILDKHTDPGMYGPTSALELDPDSGQYVYRGSGKYIPVQPGDEKPGYITFDGKLDNAFKEIEVLMDKFYFISETSPAAFGLVKGSIDSGAALKRLMMATLKKVDRLKLFTDPVLKKILAIALLLEQQQSGISFGINKLEDIEIRIEWKDGLPQDAKEQAEIEAIRTGNKATSSIKSSIKRLDSVTEEQADAEVKQIQKEEAAAVPIITKTNFNNDPPKDPPAAGGDPAAAAQMMNNK